MNNFNIINDWYFCCCIKSNPVQTQIFLSILETLDNPESDEESIIAAYHDLSLTETWMKIYAFPKVLERFNNYELKSKAYRKRVWNYFAQLIAITPPGSRSSLRDLITISGKEEIDRYELLSLVSKILNKLSGKSVAGEQESLNIVPYNDSYENLQLIMLLSIMSFLFEKDNKLSNHFQNDTTYLGIIYGALDNNYGRMPLLLASNIANNMDAGLSKKELSKKLLSKHVSICPLFEPDIIDAYIKLEYQNTETQFSTAFAEYVCLKDFGLLYGQFQIPLGNEDFTNILNRIGILENELSDREAFPIVVWQSALLGIAFKADRHRFIDLVDEYWTMPDYDNTMVSSHTPFEAPQNNDKPDPGREIQVIPRSTKDNASVLLKLKNRFIHSSGSIEDDNINWLYYSPWLCLSRQRPDDKKAEKIGAFHQKFRKGKDEKLKPLYLNSSSIANWIRLSSSLFYSLRLMQTADLETKKVKSKLALFIAHISHVLFDYNRWIRWHVDNDHDSIKNKSDKDVLSLNKSLTGLALMVHRQIKVVVSGFSPAIQPDIFIDLFKANCNPALEISGLDTDKTIFSKAFYPYVLLIWIFDAYLGAIDKSKSTKWIDCLPDIYKYFSGINNFSQFFPPSTKLFYAVPLRFLTSVYRYDSKLDWQTFIEKNKVAKWDASYQIFQITGELPPQSWIKEEWGNTETKHFDADHSDDFTRFLTIALERFVSVAKSEDKEFRFANDWKKDFRDAIIQIREKKLLNRFVRIRLIEIIDDDDIWDGSEDIRELIGLLIFEFGRAFDLQMLFRLYFRNNNGVLAIENHPNISRENVRRNLMSAMYQSIGINSVIEQEKLNAEDFFSKKVNMIEDELVKNTFSLLAYSCFLLPREHSGLLDELRSLRAESMSRIIEKNRFKTKTLEVKQINGRRELSESGKVDFYKNNVFIEAAIYNDNEKKTTLFLNDYKLEGITNLFGMADAQKGLVRSGAEKINNKVLAVFVGKDKSVNKFNCGFDEYVCVSSVPRETTLEFGDLVNLEIAKNRLDNKWSGYRIIEKLTKLSDRFCSYRKITVAGKWNADRKQPFVSYSFLDPDGSPIPDMSLNQKNFTPDYSRLFSPAGVSTYDIYIKIQDGGKENEPFWEPVYFYLPELLIDAAGLKGPIVLTLINEQEGDDGKKGWLFSYKPGKNYFIFASDFLSGSDEDDVLNSDTERLSAYLDVIPDAVGLLVTVVPGCNTSKAYLKLADNAILDSTTEILHPSLKIPFDDRNIDWRNLPYDLENDGGLFATKEGELWVLKINRSELPGFPDVVVNWNRQPRIDAQKELDIKIENPDTDWKYFGYTGEAGTISATFVETTYLLPENPERNVREERLVAFLPDYLSWNVETVLKLTIPSGTIYEGGSGNINILTSQGLQVKLEIESLTMFPVKKLNLSLIKDRDFVIVRLNPEWRPRLIEDKRDDKLSVIPSQVMEGFLGSKKKIEGIITELPIGNIQTAGYRVAWISSNNQVSGFDTITVSGNRGLRPMLGDKIEVERQQQSYRARIFTRNIFVRALWEIDGGYANRANEDSIELIRIGGVTHVEARNNPGKAVPENCGQFTVYKQLDNFKLFNIIPTKNANSPRVVLRNRDEFVFGNKVGNIKITGSSILEQVRVSEGQFSIENRGFDLKRVFRFSEDRSHNVRNLAPSIEKPTSETENLEAYELYFSNPRRLKGTYDRTRQTVKIAPDQASRGNQILFPKLMNGARKWVNEIPVSLSDGDTFIEGVGFSPNDVFFFAKKVQRNNGEEIYADFKSEKGFMAPEEFKREYDKGGADSLHFIRKEFVGNQEFILLEWGYGKHLYTPSAQLRFKNSQYSDLSVFHGDEIRRVSFTEERIDGEIKTIINIDDQRIHYAASSILFMQREENRMVHALHIEGVNLNTNSSKSDPRKYTHFKFTGIEGFSDNFKTNITHFKLNKEPDFSPEQRVMILDLLNRSAKNELILYGRINTSSFKNSNGRKFEFDSLSPSLFDKNDIDEENVLMKVSSRIESENDIFLEMVPINELAVNKKEKINLSRRYFSVREDLLGKLEEADYLHKLFVVHIKKTEGGYRASLINVPVRRNDLLMSSLGSSKNDGLVFRNGFVIDKDTVKIKDRDIRVIKIELKPGEIISLSEYDLGIPPGHLERLNFRRGDTVRIEQTEAPGREWSRLPRKIFKLTATSKGDLSFVSIEPRPCVVLPKDKWKMRIHQEEGFVARLQEGNFNNSFSIAGLPNVSATFANMANIDAIKNLLSAIHPRIMSVLIVTGRTGRARTVFDSDPTIVSGCIFWNEGSYKISLKDTQNTNYFAKGLKWEKISFSDSPANNILVRLRNETWEYHDKTAPIWKWRRNNIDIRSELLPINSGSDGVLFFQLSGSELSLRYDSSNFAKYGYPLHELIHSLEKKKEKQSELAHRHDFKYGEYVFAGRSADRRLWLEISPGRIAEFPMELVYYNDGGKAKKILLNNFNWSNLAPGDTLNLKLSRATASDPEEIELCNWTPGPRNGLVRNGRCVTQAVYHRQSGALTIGRGSFSITVPSAEEFEDDSLIGINGNNDIVPINSIGDLVQGDTIFIYFAEDGKTLKVLGFPDIVALPDLSGRSIGLWKSDSLESILIEKKKNDKLFNVEEFRQVVALLQGAIPVTFECCIDNKNGTRLYFSRRNQVNNNFLGESEITVAVIVGLVMQTKLMLRCGSQLFTMDVKEVIPYVDRKFYPQIVEELQNKLIWLHRKAGAIRSGNLNIDDVEVKVEIIAAINYQETIDVAGVLCRSTQTYKLYWIPWEHLSWCKIPASDFEKCYKPGSMFNAVILKDSTDNNPYISFIKSAEGKHEFDSFKNGMQISVKPVSKIQSAIDSEHSTEFYRYLVKSVISHIIFECISVDPQEPDDKWLVAIIDKVDGLPQVVRTIYGPKIHILDVPMSVISRSPGLPKFARLSNELSDQGDDKIDYLNSYFKSLPKDDVDIEISIFYAYNAINEGICTKEVIAAADNYFNKIVSRPYINVAFYLQAILIHYAASKMNTVGDNPKRLLTSATLNTRKLCLRALRSYHLESIANYSDIRKGLGIAEQENIRARFAAIMESLQRSIIKDSQYSQIIAFNKLLKYRMDGTKREVEPFINSLIAALGEVPDISKLIKRPINRGVIEKLRIVYLTILNATPASAIRLDANSINILGGILDSISGQEIVFFDNFLN